MNHPKKSVADESTTKVCMQNITKLEMYLVHLMGVPPVLPVPAPLSPPALLEAMSTRLLRGICCLALIRLNCRPGYHSDSVYTRKAICCKKNNKKILILRIVRMEHTLEERDFYCINRCV